MTDPVSDDPETRGPDLPHSIVDLIIPEAAAGQRLDKALALAAEGQPGLSRSRIAQAIATGWLQDQGGATVSEPKRKVKPGERYRLHLPAPAPAAPEAEAIALEVVYEDADLIVIDKPAGMVVHPAPGAPSGTLVNALLAHCGNSLKGIGGTLRPGIVHRIDKETSGLIVAAKTEAAHAGLAALFAAHDIERAYQALAWGAPDRADPRLAGIEGVSFEPGGVIRIETLLARHPTDRKRMAVRPNDGRHAVTRLRRLQRFGPSEAPVASLLEATLETGRTHQIRVHASHIGHALIGDPVYGRPRKLSPKRVSPEAADLISSFPRQALHAARLGFRHPISGKMIRFESPLPADLEGLLKMLETI